MNDTIKCESCKKDSRYAINDGCCISIDNIERETNFNFVMGADGESLFLCVDCYNKAQNLAKQIYNIVKNEDIFIGEFLREKNER